MKPSLKTATRSCLLSAGLALCVIPSAWCTTPEIEAAKQHVEKAQGLFFSLVNLPAYHHIEKLCRDAENTAADKATDQAEDAASDAGGVGNREEEEKAYQATYHTVYKQVHDSVYKNELARIMRIPKNAAEYRQAMEPVKASIAWLRKAVPALEKHDALLEKLGLAERHWKKRLDLAEKNLADYAMLNSNLSLVEHIMDDMKQALELVQNEKD